MVGEMETTPWHFLQEGESQVQGQQKADPAQVQDNVVERLGGDAGVQVALW